MQLTETVKVGHGGTHSTQLSIKISSKSATWFGALQFKIQPRSRKAGKHSEENNDNKFRKHHLQDDEWKNWVKLN